VTFGESDLAALAAVEEIEIETRSAEGEIHRTIIWAVVGEGTVYVRSYRGATARWYREASVDPNVEILLDGRRLEARVAPATDPASVKASSAAFRRKYAGDPSMGAMVRPEVLDTTMKVEPRATAAPGAVE
jgi:hypothetical protein